MPGSARRPARGAGASSAAGTVAILAMLSPLGSERFKATFGPAAPPYCEIAHTAPHEQRRQLVRLGDRDARPREEGQCRLCVPALLLILEDAAPVSFMAARPRMILRVRAAKAASDPALVLAAPRGGPGARTGADGTFARRRPGPLAAARLSGPRVSSCGGRDPVVLRRSTSIARGCWWGAAHRDHLGSGAVPLHMAAWPLPLRTLLLSTLTARSGGCAALRPA
jgi:hypothetical protein